MKDDITYQIVNEIKLNIKEFIDKIQDMSKKSKFGFCQSDKDFFSFIAKHIIFFKYLCVDQKTMYFYKVLISDLYYLILSIIKNEIRYMYVNERSIIENYMRILMKMSIKDTHITGKIFEGMKKKDFKCDFGKDEYSLIKSEYSVSCSYIHGADILNDNLAYVFEECMNRTFEIEARKKYYMRIQKMLKIFDRLIIAENTAYISGCFHRKKSVMEYLMGEKQVDLLFEILN